MTPLERAARALCELAGNPPGATMNGKALWQDYLPEVRAVIAAIREPSQTMVNAGNRTKPYNVTGNCEGTIHPVVQRAWPAMIDAMLAEE